MSRSINYQKNADLKKALSQMSRPTDLILHPSKVPNASEVTDTISNAMTFGAAAIENDIRSTLTSPSVQQGRFTDRLSAWGKISSFEQLHAIIPQERIVQIVGAEHTTLESIKSAMEVKNLTLEEFRAIASYGSQEVLSLSDYLHIYYNYSWLGVCPKLAIDFQDGNSVNEVFAELESLSLESKIYVLMERDMASFSSVKSLLYKKRSSLKVGFVPSSDIIKDEGIDAFKGCVRSAVADNGAKILCIKVGEIDLVNDAVSALPAVSEIKMIAYVPPNEFDIQNLIRAVDKNPSLTALQVDN